MSSTSVRYIVDDVDAAIEFYCEQLGFELQMHPDPAFAMLTRGDLRLVLVSPVGSDHPGGGSRPMPDGAIQHPGGWNRIMLEVAVLEDVVADLRAQGVRFRNEIVTGIGSKQILVEDRAGNVVELFEPIRGGRSATFEAATGPGTRRSRGDGSAFGIDVGRTRPVLE